MNYLQIAQINQPEGHICHFCKKPNDFADDIGFFYIIDPRLSSRDTYPVCRTCYSIYKHKHIELYGLGER